MKQGKINYQGVISLVIIILLGVGFYVKLNNYQGKSLPVVSDLISLQMEKEAAITTTGYTFTNPKVIIDPYGNSPLTALILFETETAVAPTITIKGKDELTTFTHTFPQQKKHYLSVFGLYADTDNEVTVKINTEEKVIKIKTEPLPTGIVQPTSIKANKEKLTNDLYFFTPASRGYTCTYDVNGDIRWYLTAKAAWNLERLANGRLLLSTERVINAPYYTTGLYELDLFGKIYNEYSLPGGYHHDYYEMENGNLLVASNNFYDEAGTVEDTIVEIERTTGEIVKTFDLKKVLNMNDGKSESWTPYDWFHNNSVWYDQKTNSIVLSGRHQDAVINIDYETGALNWIIGDSTNWSEAYQKYFFTPVGDLEWQWSQHAAKVTPEGYIFLLDNGNNKSKIKAEYVPATESYTRGVIYKIDKEAMTIEQLWQYGKERGSEFYSPYISDVDYLDPNHYLVHSGGIVYVNGEVSNQPAGIGGADRLVSDTVEILNDEVIFEIILPTNYYRVEKLSLYGEHNFSLGTPNRYGTLGETPVSSKKTGFIWGKTPDQDFKGRNFKITKEHDRLVVTGQYKKENTVKIILEQNFTQYHYDVRVSKKPYTALCIDIFTETETEHGIVVTKYINAKGLEGKYNIYIELDGKRYNLKKTVTF